MRGREWTLIGAVVVLFLRLRVATGGGVACSSVIAQINHGVTAEHGRAADMSHIAKTLGTSPAWVEHCMLAYGRRPKRPGLESAEGREERLESLEENEPEETAPEDKEEEGAPERPEHPEKERQLKVRPTPTPDFFE